MTSLVVYDVDYKYGCVNLIVMLTYKCGCVNLIVTHISSKSLSMLRLSLLHHLSEFDIYQLNSVIVTLKSHYHRYSCICSAHVICYRSYIFVY